MTGVVCNITQEQTVSCEERNSEILSMSTTHSHNEPNKESLWCISSSGDIFTSGKESVQFKDGMYIREIDLGGRFESIVFPLRVTCVPGTEFVFKLLIEKAVKVSSVNLTYANPFDEVALHFNALFDRGSAPSLVVRDTMIKGRWTKQEIEGGMPFQQDKEFELTIKCHPEEYDIYVDGKQFCTYKHRLPLNTPSYIRTIGRLQLFKLTIKSPHAILHPNMSLQKIGGSLKYVESCFAGVTWGLDYDNMVWFYNGKCSRSFFDNLHDNHSNTITDFQDFYLYENQRMITDKHYTPNGFLEDHSVVNDLGIENTVTNNFDKLLTLNWHWVTNWSIDFEVPGVDKEGWIYTTNTPSNDDLLNEKYMSNVRQRRWHRLCAITSKGPWQKLENIKLLDVSLTISSNTSVSTAIVWAIAHNGETLVRNGVSQSNPQGTDWKSVDTNHAFVSISCGPFDQVWGATKDGSVYKREGIQLDNVYGDSWVQIDTPLNVEIKQISVGEIGVWGLDKSKQLYVRQEINTSNKKGTSWKLVQKNPDFPGPDIAHFNRVSVGRNLVWAITDTGAAVRRHGISIANPEGLAWRFDVPGTWKHFCVRAL